MRKEELINYAMKGILADIRDLEKQVEKGKQYLRMIENRGEVPTKLSINEIQAVITQKREEIERLDRMRFDLQWELNNPEEQ